MGFITRIKRLTTSRIETFLTTVEDPEILFPQLVKEMEEQIRKATSAEAKAMAGTKAAQRELDTVKDKLDRMQKGASLAMDQGDEDTAREAITAQISLKPISNARTRPSHAPRAHRTMPEPHAKRSSRNSTRSATRRMRSSPACGSPRTRRRSRGPSAALWDRPRASSTPSLRLRPAWRRLNPSSKSSAICRQQGAASPSTNASRISKPARRSKLDWLL